MDTRLNSAYAPSVGVDAFTLSENLQINKCNFLIISIISQPFNYIQQFSNYIHISYPYESIGEIV